MRNEKITPLYERLSRDDELQGESNSIKEITERHRVWFSQMGNRRGYQALYVGRSMDEHSIDSNRSTDHGEQTEATEVCKK